MNDRHPSVIDGEGLWALLDEMAKYGARSDGGVDRQALSEAERRLRGRLIEIARSLGGKAFIDPAGNMFFKREGREAVAPVVIGSHIDTQPAGGRYDGAYGVAVGLAVLEALQTSDVITRRPIEIVIWNNEEGVRFGPGTTGSALFAGRLKWDDVRDQRDADGNEFERELKLTIDHVLECDGEMRELGFPIYSFLEPHIEQGPILEDERIPIGIVESVQGARWYNVEVSGETAHAGTTPLNKRRDAFSGAMELIQAVRDALDDLDDMIRLTIGRFHLWPDSVNTVPGRAEFTIDLRHPSARVLDELDAEIRRLAGEGRSSCRLKIDEIMFLPPAYFSSDVISLLEDCAKEEQLGYRRMVSGAFHDAVNLAALTQAAMIFIPCHKGLSHCPEENIKLEDAVAGANLTLRYVLQASR